MWYVIKWFLFISVNIVLVFGVLVLGGAVIVTGINAAIRIIEGTGGEGKHGKK